MKRGREERERPPAQRKHSKRERDEHRQEKEQEKEQERNDDIPLVRVTRRHAMPILLERCREHLFGPLRAVKVQAYGAAVDKALSLSLELPEKISCCKRVAMRTYTFLPPPSLPVDLLRSPEKQRSALTDGVELRQRRLPAVELTFRLC